MTRKNTDIPIGFAARLFSKTRTAAEEIRFGDEHNFHAIQFRGPEEGLDEQYLRDELESVSALFAQTQIIPTVELLIGLNHNGQTPSGKTPLDILSANIPAITKLNVQYVHWHLYPLDYADMDDGDVRPLEEAVVPEFEKAISLSKKHDFAFGIENNSPEGLMFSRPDRCHQLLEQVPDLKFVWDLNHTLPEHVTEFQQLAGKMSMLHVSDTRLPETNEHLPMGLGSIDFSAYLHPLQDRGFKGPAVFEIGGLPKSGGFGRDTDEALLRSCDQLASHLSAHSH